MFNKPQAIIVSIRHINPHFISSAVRNIDVKDCMLLIFGEKSINRAPIIAARKKAVPINKHFFDSLLNEKKLFNKLII